MCGGKGTKTPSAGIFFSYVPAALFWGEEDF
jgi:hypothetical protein